MVNKPIPIMECRMQIISSVAHMSGYSTDSNVASICQSAWSSSTDDRFFVCIQFSPMSYFSLWTLFISLLCLNNSYTRISFDLKSMLRDEIEWARFECKHVYNLSSIDSNRFRHTSIVASFYSPSKPCQRAMLKYVGFWIGFLSRMFRRISVGCRSIQHVQLHAFHLVLRNLGSVPRNKILLIDDFCLVGKFCHRSLSFTCRDTAIQPRGISLLSGTSRYFLELLNFRSTLIPFWNTTAAPLSNWFVQWASAMVQRNIKINFCQHPHGAATVLCFLYLWSSLSLQYADR